MKNAVWIIVFLLLGYCFLPRPVSSYPISVQQDTMDYDTLAADTLAIEEIVIHKKNDALEKFEAKKAYHKEIYLLGDNKNMVTIPMMGGIAINIQKVYNHFSRRGKGARRLQRQFEREYEDDQVQEIWNGLVGEYTTLTGDSLARFTMYSKPTLQFLQQASSYERIAYVLQKLKSYRDSSSVIHQRFDLKAESIVRE